jgi:hypothetical protein
MRACEVCGESLEGRKPNARFCSPRCRKRGYTQRPATERGRRRDSQRRWKLELVQRMVESGRLTIRQATPDERAAWVLRPEAPGNLSSAANGARTTQ